MERFRAIACLVAAMFCDLVRCQQECFTQANEEVSCFQCVESLKTKRAS